MSEEEPSHIGIIALMDDCLIAITDGEPLPEKRLRLLPPWRAVMMLRVAAKAGLASQDQVDALVEEARMVGGEGELTP